MKTFKSEAGKRLVFEAYDRVVNLWDIDVEEMDIKGSYGTTHVIAAGNPDNPPLVLFHGVSDNSAGMWIYNARGLAERFRIYAVDAIGASGKSIPGPSYGKGFNQTKWINELLDTLGIEKTDVAGVSYGCYLVQLLKVELPERIDRAIGISGSIAVEGSKSPYLKMISAFFPEALFPTDKNISKLMSKLTGDNAEGLILNPGLLELIKLQFLNFNNMSMSFHKLRKFTVDEINNIRGDLKLLIGDMDFLSYYPHSLRMLEKTRINYEIIKGCGHIINYEKPEEINRLIMEFLL